MKNTGRLPNHWTLPIPIREWGSGSGEHTQEEHASKNWITVPMGTANEGYVDDLHSGLHTQSLALQS